MVTVQFWSEPAISDFYGKHHDTSSRVAYSTETTRLNAAKKRKPTEEGISDETFHTAAYFLPAIWIIV